MTFTYEITVECEGDECTAVVDGSDAIRGYGKTPIEALASLVQCLVEWPRGGSDRWLDTPSGVKLARMFVPGFEPGRQVEPS